MYFYGLSDRQVLAMPIDRFWLCNRNIDRLRAEEDLRHVNVVARSGSEEALKSLIQDLKAQMGEVFAFDHGKLAMKAAVRDPDAKSKLLGKGTKKR